MKIVTRIRREVIGRKAQTYGTPGRIKQEQLAVYADLMVSGRRQGHVRERFAYFRNYLLQALNGGNGDMETGEFDAVSEFQCNKKYTHSYEKPT